MEPPSEDQVAVLRAPDQDLVYLPVQDGFFPAVPSLDRDGDPADFSLSPTLAGAENVALAGQGVYDTLLGSAHLGIWSSPEAWRVALRFLRPQAK